MAALLAPELAALKVVQWDTMKVYQKAGSLGCKLAALTVLNLAVQ